MHATSRRIRRGIPRATVARRSPPRIGTRPVASSSQRVVSTRTRTNHEPSRRRSRLRRKAGAQRRGGGRGILRGAPRGLVARAAPPRAGIPRRARAAALSSPRASQSAPTPPKPPPSRTSSRSSPRKTSTRARRARARAASAAADAVSDAILAALASLVGTHHATPDDDDAAIAKIAAFADATANACGAAADASSGTQPPGTVSTTTTTGRRL